MSKALASYPEERRRDIASRRIMADTKGCGYWGARDYYDKFKLKYPGKAGAAQAVAKAMENAKHDATGFHMGEDEVSAPRDRRHKGGGFSEDAPRSKPKGRGHRDRNPTARERRAKGVGMSPLRGKFHAVGGGRKPSPHRKTSAPHFNRPRLVGASR